MIEDLFVFKMGVMLNGCFLHSFSYLHHFFSGFTLTIYPVNQKIKKIKVQTESAYSNEGQHFHFSFHFGFLLKQIPLNSQNSKEFVGLFL